MDHSNGTTGPDSNHIDLTTDGATAVAARPPASDGPPAGRAPSTSSFLDELARAMQAAADRERERIAAAVAEDATANVTRARARGAAETGELRRMAEEDVAGIGAWLKSEIERVRREAARRTDERRADLDAYLRQHDSIIESEVASVDAAVGDYRTTLDRFFGDLGQATNPSDIASRAGHLPSPPDLEAVRAAARADAVAALSGPDAPLPDGPGSDPGAGAPGAGHTGGKPINGTRDAAGASVLAAAETVTASADDRAWQPAVLHDVEGDAEDADDAQEPGAVGRLFRSLTGWAEIL
jgi:hypothetical protein